MFNISSISIKTLITSFISVFSVLAIILAFYISHHFKQESFSANQRISSQFIHVTATEAIANLNKLLKELGGELQSDKTLRKQFKTVIVGKHSPSSLSEMLNESFHRRFHTAGFIYIEKIRAYDTNLNYLASSSEGKRNFVTELNSEMKNTAASREGSEKLKILNKLWFTEENSYYSALIPIGGLRVKGYLEVVVNPSHNLKTIEKALNAPINIVNSVGVDQHRSENWPESLDNFVLAEYHFSNLSGKKILGIKAAIDNTRLISQMNTARNTALLLFVVASSIFVVLAMLFLNKTLFKPVRDLVHEMNEASSGNLLVEIDNFGITEVHHLSNTLEELVSSLRSNVQVILDNSTNLFNSATRLSFSADQNKSSIFVQQAQTEQVATAMNEMNATVSEVARNTSAAAKAANDSHEKSVLGKEIVDSAVHTINNLSDSIKQSESLIEKLNDESKAISSILDVITSISEQTNLLALNAAIEAARAGEAGRGFAVVADEVRTLATKTQESASDIRHMVKSLQDGTLGAVESMNVSRSTADKAVDEIDLAGKTIDEVSAAVMQMSDINIQIATAAEEQTVVVEEINQSVVRIKDVGIENSKIASETAKDGVNLLQVAELLGLSVKKFKI